MLAEATRLVDEGCRIVVTVQDTSPRFVGRDPVRMADTDDRLERNGFFIKFALSMMALGIISPWIQTLRSKTVDTGKHHPQKRD